MSYRDLPSDTPREDTYEVEENTIFLGYTADQRATVFDEQEGVVREVVPDHVNERLLPAAESESPSDDADHEITSADSVGEALDRVGEEVGWQSLSSFAQEHLESAGENDEGENGA